MTLTCDDCGSVQPADNTRCELCGASLREEAQRKEEGSLIGLLFAALVTTAFFCVLPGALVRHRFFPDVGIPLFGGGWVAAWLAASALARWYSPRHGYDFGGYYVGLRQSSDRAHAAVGFLLLPIVIVTGLWGAIAHRLIRR